MSQIGIAESDTMAVKEPVKRKKYITRRQTRPNIPMNEDELLFWTLICCGDTVPQASKAVDITHVSGYKWLDRLMGFLKGKVDIDTYRLQSSRLWPLAMDSLRHHLQNKDVQMTISWLKGHGIFNETLMVGRINEEEAKDIRRKNHLTAFEQLGIDCIDITPESVEDTPTSVEERESDDTRTG